MKRRPPRSAKPSGSPTKDDLLARIAALARELGEAREQQTATSEILKVISRSTFDLQPVLDALIENATKLCDARQGIIYRFDGEVFRVGAIYGASPEFIDFWRQGELRPGRGSIAGRVAVERRTVQVLDIVADPEYEQADASRIGGFRTTLGVPMLREGVLVGTIFIWRTEVRAFSDQQIDVVTSFADQAVIAIENVRLFTELEARNAELTETLGGQMATAEVLRAISRAQTDAQPVFDIIATSARRLCGASYGQVQLYDGELIHLAAFDNVEPEGAEAIRRAYPLPIAESNLGGRVIGRRAVVQIPDLLEDRAYQYKSTWESSGLRSLLGVPMLKDGEPIGAIAVGRPEPGSFPDTQVELLKTFADQAVIAIENVRLFTELEARNRDLTQALDRQTATAEILGVISSSPTDVQPVLDAVAESAARLCGALDSLIFRVDGNLMTRVAHFGPVPSMSEARAVTSDTPTGRAILERRAIHVTDILDELAHGEYIGVRSFQQGSGFRTVLCVPLVREDSVIGAIVIRRLEARPFTEQQIELVKTFADQAVIAIENVRLFTALEARNRDLTEALDTQTATSEILQVISGSQTDVQPVFDTIVASAVRLCGGESAVVYRFEDEVAHFAAQSNLSPETIDRYRQMFPRPLGDTDYLWRIADGSVLNLADIEQDARSARVGAAYRTRGARSAVWVPMVREGKTIGAISVSHGEVAAFSDERVQLLKTFADQAVIAIENARLFNALEARTAELTRSVGELTALGDVSRALSSTLDLETVLETIVARANELTGAAGCTIWEYDESREEFRLRVSHYADAADAAVLQAPGRVTAMRKGQGVTSRVVERREPVQIPDIAAEGAYESPIRGLLVAAGHRALLGVPLLSEDEVIGVLAVTRKTPGEFEPDVVRLLTTFATQSALAIQNARLFLEIEDKSQQLQMASQHKSEFLANMSHELRTPLNAIIGFSEVLAEGMFGEINDKQAEYLRDILESGRHLLSLINDILDLSKIEAGRMELELEDFDVPGAVDNALTLVRERAGRRGIALGRAMDGRVGAIRADERKVKQVLLNLLSNAIKFTPEGGRVDVRAAANDTLVEVSVADTGVGIAPEDQEAVFEEFRQVGTAAKKVEGTGLGLALSRKFIELHGGRIWVKSEVGVGSTFTFTLPRSR